MPAINQYERNYKILEEILGDLSKLPEYLKLKSSGFMDLNMDNLGNNRIALSHNYEQNGDLIPDPDMEIHILPELKAIEALSYQDTYGYQAVYPEPGKVNIRAKQKLNAFLSHWLKNLSDQGFKRQIDTEKTTE
jgi:uncharacterized protein YqiB (DUF1249 family)